MTGIIKTSRGLKLVKSYCSFINLRCMMKVKGNSGEKERVKQMLPHKKIAARVSAAALVIVLAAGFLLAAGRQRETAPANPSDPGAGLKPISSTFSGTAKVAYSSDYTRVRVEYLSELMGFKSANEFEATDSQTVAFIDSTLKTGVPLEGKKDLENNYTNRYRIELANELGGYSCGLYYDTLYDKAYIAMNGGLYEIGTDFARYINSLFEYASLSFNIEDAKAVELFKSYGWTLDYRINVLKNKLSADILSGFKPRAYYFAYNNELSKDIGLDMSACSGPDGFDVEIYRIHESMPREFYPIQNARGIVVKSGGQISGAFISAGRHSTFSACSLKGHSFETVTGQTLDQWLADKVKADSGEEKLSQLEPEEIIEAYFTSLDKKDAGATAACLAKKALLENLTVNMANDQLYNEEISLPLARTYLGTQPGLASLKSAKLLKVEMRKEANDYEKTFRVDLDLQYHNQETMDKGEQTWDCSMVNESPQTGWKIVDFGH